jgi:hypothetical protein
MISAMMMSEGVAANEREEFGIGRWIGGSSVAMDCSHALKKREAKSECPKRSGSREKKYPDA